MHVCVYVCMCVCVYVCMYVCMYVHVHVHVLNRVNLVSREQIARMVKIWLEASLTNTDPRQVELNIGRRCTCIGVFLDFNKGCLRWTV